MKKEKIEMLQNKKVSLEILTQIEESEDVQAVDCLGYSGQFPGYYWFSVEFTDGTDIDIFCKSNDEQ